MTLEEATNIALEHNLKPELLNRNRDCHYRMKVIESIGSDNFIDSIILFKTYLKNEKLLSDELCDWFKNGNIPLSLRSEFDLDSYLVAGMVPLKDMEEGYYLGKCRNAIVARWNKSGFFEHTRSKHGYRNVERIFHLEEPNIAYDLFVPIRKLEEHEVNMNNKIENWK